MGADLQVGEAPRPFGQRVVDGQERAPVGLARLAGDVGEETDVACRDALGDVHRPAPYAGIAASESVLDAFA